MHRKALASLKMHKSGTASFCASRYDRLDRWLLGSVPSGADADEAEGYLHSDLRGGPAANGDTSRMLLLLAPAGLVGFVTCRP